MADREPTRNHSGQSPASDDWLGTEPMDQAESATFGLDLDLNSAINETLANVSPSAAMPNPAAAAPSMSVDLAGFEEAAIAEPATTPAKPVVPAAKAATKQSSSTDKTAAASANAVVTPAAQPVKPVVTPVNEVIPDEQPTIRVKGWTDRLLMRSVPSWMISMILHVAILMTLAAIQIEPVRDAIGVMVTAVASDETQGLEEGLELNEPSPMDDPAPATSMDQAMPAASASQFSASEIALTDTASLVQPVEAAVDVGSFGAMVENIVPSSALNASASRISGALNGRSSGARKSELLERFGGNAASEKSVQMALDWIAKHQDRSGGWTFGHSAVCRGECKGDGQFVEAVNGATALALLPFLGAGQTHLEGKYKTTVLKGLQFLISRMKVTNDDIARGSWHEARGNMYSHGLASIVVCEAYAMTRDPNLLQPAQLALNYIMYAQDPRGGGWRYNPKQPGDTSVVGWQLMALKSGSMGNLSVSNDCLRKAESFLNFVSVNDGAYYGYDGPTSNFEGRASTTAVGLLCRMYLGWPKEKPGIKAGVAFLAKRGPNIEDLYYSYYATQVMRQHGGDEWNNWNKVMRDSLIKAQVTEGHAAGSWYMEKGPHHDSGGRLYCTALSTMILEVYYRHMPLYSDKSSDDKFEF